MTITKYDSHDADTALNHRTGEEIEILRPVTADEADIEEVGPMFKVRFPDGFETDVFEDEIVEEIDS